ncbi:MAG TPA: GNAT family N-acetyltransferase [Tepidisphaeraceae bacterium]|jgi:ribosomal protein S18 acetylase RimI-like enzyme|nr:GNAT family N-acetyltransferase [Tepidisphaeraceae bacterium]
MEIRPVTPHDIDSLVAIDGSIESARYIHVDRAGEGLAVQWRLDERPLRQKRIDRNRPGDDEQFLLKQIVHGIEEGIALLAEHEGIKVALAVAQPQLQFKTMKVADIRVDFDSRRLGLATAMLFQAIAEARTRELRAVTAECRTDNLPANKLFEKLGFELAGLDVQRHTNHDLVKESATLFWYLPLE